MIFETPLPFTDALKRIAGQTPNPTDLSTDEIRTQWSRQVRAMSVYSARTTCADYLHQAKLIFQQVVNGEINEATGRQRLQLWLDRAGYTPEKGFPGQPNAVPPADKNTLRDLSSDKRVKLMIETNLRLAANTGFMAAGMSEDALNDFPCWELVRIYPRLHPRGSTDKDDDLGWKERWVRCGGKLTEGRMIARKDDPIWSALGDSGVFRDGTDSDAPPYAFNSGYGIRSVPRKECIALGIIDASKNVKSRQLSLASDFFDGSPERQTISSLSAGRAALSAALASLREAA